MHNTSSLACKLRGEGYCTHAQSWWLFEARAGRPDINFGGRELILRCTAEIGSVKDKGRPPYLGTCGANPLVFRHHGH